MPGFNHFLVHAADAQFVKRTPGAMAKMMVAMMPGTTPTRNMTSAGIRYTMAGMVCMKSMMGRMIAETRRELAAQMPKGTLMATATTVAMTTSAMECMVFSHWSTPATTAKLSSVPTPSFQPLAHHAMAAKIRMIAQKGGAFKTQSSPS